MLVSELIQALDLIEIDKTSKITLSCKKTELCQYKKLTAKKTKDGFQIERFTDKQVFHENIKDDELKNILQTEMSENFRQLNALCAGFDVEIKISKKGKVLKNKRKNTITSDFEAVSHNRKKNYIFEEGIFVPALYELGVMTADGKIVASKYDKFKQINRFIECVDDALKNENSDFLEIIDFGCGKSYLTFVLYYYMTEIQKRKVHITGLDLKKDVIEKCKKIAEKYRYSNLDFLCGDIKDYKPSKAPDMVMTLHACDTATDFALYNAIIWDSKYIFSVPCCQHELNQKHIT
ncbi:MAG: SAM-dependent methyltransferase [Ruminococcaceae bacterium]|nr:SAM-dependent methyltransferase [Oscillospiraceae bacterium]